MLRENSLANNSGSALPGGPAGQPRLSDVLFDTPTPTFATIAALPSNVEAVESALMFGSGLSAFVCLVGTSGWGKSHLLQAAAGRLRQAIGGRIEVVSSTDYISSGRQDSPLPLLLDDVQEVLARPRQRQMMRLALERRVRGGRPTMLAFTLPKSSRLMKNLLPSTREWLIGTIAEPQPSERILVLCHIAKAEGLSLSPALVRIIANHMHGNGRTLEGALKRLRLSGAVWVDSSAVLRACGLLEPFFADSTGWDLRLKVLRTAESNRSRFPQVHPHDLAIYTMLKEAHLAEADVARLLGIEPSDAYLRASRFRTQLESNETLAIYVRQFADLVIQSLTCD